MKTKWIDRPSSTAEQIEIALRSEVKDQSDKLATIIANCNVMIVNTRNAQLREFAKIIIKLASQ